MEPLQWERGDVVFIEGVEMHLASQREMASIINIKLMMRVRRRMTRIRIVMMIMIGVMLMIGKKLTRYQFFAAPYRPQDFSKFLLCKSLVDKKHLR